VSEGENEILKGGNEYHSREIWGRSVKKVSTRIATQKNSPGQKKVNVALFCKLFGISRQAIYQREKSTIRRRNNRLLK